MYFTIHRMPMRTLGILLLFCIHIALMGTCLTFFLLLWARCGLIYLVQYKLLQDVTLHAEAGTDYKHGEDQIPSLTRTPKISPHCADYGQMRS